MEEAVGLWWHRTVTRWADPGHAPAAVTLAQVRRPIEMLFRAGGGGATVRLAEAGLARTGGTRGWLQRVAGEPYSAIQPALVENVPWMRGVLTSQSAMAPRTVHSRGAYCLVSATGSALLPGMETSTCSNSTEPLYRLSLSPNRSGPKVATASGATGALPCRKATVTASVCAADQPGQADRAKAHSNATRCTSVCTRFTASLPDKPF